MNTYFKDLNKLPNNKIINDMRKYAKANKVPIINDEGLTFMLTLVDILKPKKFLEIGTAIGFCSICIATENPNLIIDTIEKDDLMYNESLRNIKAAKLEDRIRVHYADALDFALSNLEDNYDIIFIDAAKAQYSKFFEKYEVLLDDDGAIITDNLLFHGLVINHNSIENKNLKSLVSKIDYFNFWLKKNKKYYTYFLDTGDGIAISRRVKKK